MPGYATTYARSYVGSYARGYSLGGVQRASDILIDTPIAINGQTPERSLALAGYDASGSGWTTRTYPSTPIEFGATGTTPLSVTTYGGLGGIKFAGAGAVGDNVQHYNAPTNTTLDLRLNDCYWECIVLTPATAATTAYQICCKRLPLATQALWGFQLTTVSGALRPDFAIRNASGTLSRCQASVPVQFSTAYFLCGYANRDEASAAGSQNYANGQILGDGVDLSARSGDDVVVDSQPFSIGATYAGGYGFGGTIFYFSIVLAANLIAAGAGGKNEITAIVSDRYNLIASLLS